MSVIVDLRVDLASLPAGKALGGDGASLDGVVASERGPVPLVWLDLSTDPAALDGGSVVDVAEVCTEDGRRLCALDVDTATTLFHDVHKNGGRVIGADAGEEDCRLSVRFPNDAAFDRFGDQVEGAEAVTLHDPVRLDGPGGYGLTDSQREALVLAVETGYYDIPRTCTTVELAERLGISDQATTERLRRAVVNLVESTLARADDCRS